MRLRPIVHGSSGAPSHPLGSCVQASTGEAQIRRRPLTMESDEAYATCQSARDEWPGSAI